MFRSIVISASTGSSIIKVDRAPCNGANHNLLPDFISKLSNTVLALTFCVLVSNVSIKLPTYLSKTLSCLLLSLYLVVKEKYYDENPWK